MANIITKVELNRDGTRGCVSCHEGVYSYLDARGRGRVRGMSSEEGREKVMVQLARNIPEYEVVGIRVGLIDGDKEEGFYLAVEGNEVRLTRQQALNLAVDLIHCTYPEG